MKPENFAIGGKSQPGTVCIIDYGLAKKYRDPNTRMHIPFRDNKRLTGTARYASIFTHMGIEQSRRDDLECLGYSLIYLLKGELPWQGTKAGNLKEKHNLVKEMKVNMKTEELCKDLPIEFSRYVRYCRGLKFEDRPDYAQLKTMFRNLFYQRHLEASFKFDWVELGINIENLHAESFAGDETNLAECPMRRCCARGLGTGDELRATEISVPETIPTVNPAPSARQEWKLQAREGGEQFRSHKSFRTSQAGEERRPSLPSAFVPAGGCDSVLALLRSQHEARLAMSRTVEKRNRPQPRILISLIDSDRDSCDLKDTEIVEDLGIYSTHHNMLIRLDDVIPEEKPVPVNIKIPQATYIHNDAHWTKNRRRGIRHDNRRCGTYVPNRQGRTTISPQLHQQSRTCMVKVARAFQVTDKENGVGKQ